MQLSTGWSLVVALLITPVGLWVVRLVFQGFWVNPLRYDWMSFNADTLLGLGVWASIYLSHAMPYGSGYTKGTGYALLNWANILAWTVFAALRMWSERKQVDSWKRRLGATSVYHFLIFVYYAPFMTLLYINTLFAPWSGLLQIAAHLVPVVAVVSWLLLGLIYDPKHQMTPNGRSKHDYTSPVDGWYTIWLLQDWRRERRRARGVW